MSNSDGIKFYEISSEYIEYLRPYAIRLYTNFKKGDKNKRKYIGIVLHINGLDYFAPLSSSKKKHKYIQEGLDFIKIKHYAVINLNNMFPVPMNECTPVVFSDEKNITYRYIMLGEYRYIKMIREKIWKNARLLYNYKLKFGSTTPLAKRCNDFRLLEEKCKEYIEKHQ